MRKLDDWLRTFMERFKTNEAPHLFKAWTGVSIIGSAMERKCWTVWNERVFPNMYILLVGPPAVRKGTIMSPAKKILQELDTYIAAESTTREQLIRRIKESMNQYLYQDRLLFQCCLNIFSEEFTVLITRNSSEMVTNLNNWYDCQPTWRYETKGSGIDEIQNMCISILGATTPELIQLTFPEEAKGGGFISRTIFVYADTKSRVTVWPQETEEERRLQELLVNDLKQINQMVGEFKMSDEFKALYEPFYLECNEHPALPDPIFQHYNGRRPRHMWKLSMIFSASRSGDMVLTGEDFTRALSLLEKTEKFMPKCFQGRGKVEHIDVLESILAKLSLDKKIPVQKLMKDYLKDISSFELQTMISTLRQSGVAKLEVDSSGRQYLVLVEDLKSVVEKIKE